MVLSKSILGQRRRRKKHLREGKLTIQIREDGQREDETNPEMEIIMEREKKEFTMTWGDLL